MPKRPTRVSMNKLLAQKAIRESRDLNAEIDTDPEPSRDLHIRDDGPGWAGTIIVHDKDDVE